MKKTLMFPALLAALIPAAAFAHSGGGATHGFAAGLSHPVMGADHLAAMLAVGLWSGFVLPARIWAGAAAFMAAMAAGAGLAWSGAVLPGAEAMIMASVVIFGVMLALSRRNQPGAVTALSLAVIAVFAASHGYAHAAESTGSATAYLAGFLIATGLLHLAGIALARIVARIPFSQGLLGGLVAGGGLMLMAGG